MEEIKEMDRHKTLMKPKIIIMAVQDCAYACGIKSVLELSVTYWTDRNQLKNAKCLNYTKLEPKRKPQKQSMQDYSHRSSVLKFNLWRKLNFINEKKLNFDRSDRCFKILLVRFTNWSTSDLSKYA